jgi:dihydrofolate synthase/folylpolyglutamate synthase
MGFCEDKDIREMLALMPSDAHYIFTRANMPRAASAEKVMEAASASGLMGEWVDDVPTAIERAKAMLTEQDMLFIGGSTFVVAEAL